MPSSTDKEGTSTPKMWLSTDAISPTDERFSVHNTDNISYSFHHILFQDSSNVAALTPPAHPPLSTALAPPGPMSTATCHLYPPKPAHPPLSTTEAPLDPMSTATCHLYPPKPAHPPLSTTEAPLDPMSTATCHLYPLKPFR